MYRIAKCFGWQVYLIFTFNKPGIHSWKATKRIGGKRNRNIRISFLLFVLCLTNGNLAVVSGNKIVKSWD